MKKLAVSVVVLAAMVFGLWSLLQGTGGSEPDTDLSIVTAAEAAPSAQVPQASEIEGLRLDEDSAVSRLAVEEPVAGTTAAAPAAKAVEKSPEESTIGLEVLVVDSAKRPVEGATVTLAQVGLDPLVRFSRRRLRGASQKTDEHGLIRVALKADGMARVIAKADGFAPGFSEVLALGMDSAYERVEVILTEGGSVRGQLLDLQGAPAPDVRISLQLREWPGSTERTSTLQSEMTETAADGTLLFENVTPGSYTLYTHAPDEDQGRVPDDRVELEVEEGRETVVQFAEVSDSFVRVHGEVIRNSVPFPHARINIGWADRSRGYLAKSAQADEEGRFDIVLDEAAMYRFQISGANGRGSVFREVDIPPEEDHEVVISFETGSLSGVLLGPDGEPVEGMEVTAFGRSPKAGSGSTIQSTRSGAGGVFEFSDLVSATYRVEAKTIPIGGGARGPLAPPEYPYHGGAELKGIEVNAGASLDGLELQLSAAAAIDGKVSDSSGKARPGARIEIRGSSPMDNSQWRADKLGKFLAGGLKPGRYHVRAIRQQEVSPWVAVQADANATITVEDLVLQAGTIVDVEARLGSDMAGRCHASVRDGDGRRGASTILRNGKGQLGPLLPGNYTVRVKEVGGDNEGASQELIVNGEQTLKVDIQLPD